MIDVSLRRVASGIATLLAVVVLAAFVVQAVPALVGADASYVVLSGSMEPSISPGDAVIVDDVDAADLESGDVITFTRGDESTPVTHRVIEVVDGENGLAFRTKGDANDDADPQPVPAENVTGQVWFAIPYIGHVVLFANTPKGLVTLVGLPIVAFIASELYTYATAGEGAASERPEAEAATGEGAASEDTTDAAADSATTATTTTVADDQVEEADGSAESGDAIELTPADLKFSSVAFTALAGYSGYVAYTDPSPLHVAVFAAAAMVVAFAAAVILAGGQSSPSSEAATVAATEEATEATDGAGPEYSPDDGVTDSVQRTEFAFDGSDDTVADGGHDPETGGDDSDA